ncbi:MAG: flagellar biosynthesis/type III secretory pathway chaperone [Paracoccaceae bacterium]|jgi:flagellar biosynthesis/type III secretory pathway chaperone
MSNSGPLGKLKDVLDTEYVKLKSGDMSRLTDSSSVLESVRKALTDLPISDIDTPAISALQQAAARNERVLRACLRGVASAREMLNRRAGGGTFSAYQPDGGQNMIGHQKRSFERRS